MASEIDERTAFKTNHVVSTQGDSLSEIESSSEAHSTMDNIKIDFEEDDGNISEFTLQIGCTFSVYKPLIPLKLALFLWYGGASFTGAFLTLFFKHRGITLSELSYITALSPVVQILGTVASGILADKIGRSKPILVANLVLVMAFLLGLLLVPSAEVHSCHSRPINLKCHPRQFDRLITKTSCDVVEDVIRVQSCNVQCPENVTEHCDGRNLICEILAGSAEMRNFSLSIYVGGSYKVRDRCYYNVSSMRNRDATYSWCNVPHKMNCRVSCMVESGVKCAEGSHRFVFLVLTMILYLLFMMTYSNVYRFMDVTAMALVKDHDSDFGRERFFAVVGILVLSPTAGYLVDATTPADSSEKNYLSAFYLFFALTFAVLITVYWLDVRIVSPGKKLWRKSVYLMKNPDVLSFALILVVLGSSFTFSKHFLFWYLEGLSASSLLVGLIPSVSSLYGLPFLATSNWWVGKIGPKNIFLLGLLGYVVSGLGYSFLTDPWYSLILEATNVFTYHLLWVAVIMNSHELAPEGLTATVISMAGSLHYHLGKTGGSLVGGLVMSKFSGPIAFRLMACICFVSAVLYSLYLLIRRKMYRKMLNKLDAVEEVSKSNESNELENLQSTDK